MQNSKKIAIVTYKRVDGHFGNGGLDHEEVDDLVAMLQSKGMEATCEHWDDPAVDWNSFDVVILKSPWDYIYRFDDFLAWIDKLEGLKCRVMNPIPILKWNSDKKYLKEMEEKGVTCIPTLFLEKNSTFSAKDAFEHFKVDKIVVKPRISGNGKNTYSMTKEDFATNEAEVNKVLQTKPVMVQPFMQEIVTKGEWAFVYFNGKFSHAALKRPKKGDFLVGEHDQIEEPPKHLLAAAQDVVDRFAPGCLYARVDALEVDGVLTLMELEITDPYLFMDGIAKKHAVNYYEALLTLLGQPQN